MNNATTGDLRALLDVISKNAELLTVIKEDGRSHLKELENINYELQTINETLNHTLVPDLVEAAITNKQLDLTNETSKLSRISQENNEGIKQMLKITNSLMPESNEILKDIKDRMWKIFWISFILFSAIGVTTVWKTHLLERSDQAIVEQMNNFQKNMSQAPIYHFDDSMRAFVITRTGDTLWLSKERNYK